MNNVQVNGNMTHYQQR